MLFEKEFDNFKRIFPITFLLSILFFFPLFNIDFPTHDEADALISGRYGRTLGRPFIDYCFKLFTLHENIINTYPLNIFLSIIILIFFVSLFYFSYKKGEANFYDSIILFSFMANPFLIGIFQFKVMSLPASLAIGLALITSIPLKNRFLNISVNSVLLAISLLIYQVGINIFFAGSLILAIFKFKESKKEGLSLLFNNTIKLLLSLLLYKLCLSNFISIAKLYIHRPDTYIRLIKFDETFFTMVLKNLSICFSELSLFFTSSKILLIFAIASLVYFLIDVCFLSKSKHPLLLFGFSILCLSGLCACLMGAQIFLTQMKIAPRTLFIFSIILLFLFHIFIYHCCKNSKKLRMLVVLPLLYLFSTSYGHLAFHRSAANFQHKLIYSIIDDLKLLNVDENKAEIIVSGQIRLVENKILKNPVLANKIIDRLSNQNKIIAWRLPVFIRYYKSYRNIHYLNTKTCPKTFIIERGHYRIAKNKNQVNIVLEEHPCFKQKSS